MLKNKNKIKVLIAITMALTFVTTDMSMILVKAQAQNITIQNSINKLTQDEINKEIKDIRLRWREDLTGGDNLDITNPTIKSKVDGISKEGKKYLDSMYKDQSRNFLWDGAKDYKTNPAHITVAYKNLYSMALAYSTKGSSLYNNNDLKNAIIDGLDWVYINAYNENVDVYGNWWDWQIGIPQQLNNVVVLMYDNLNDSQIQNYMKAIDKFLPHVMPGSKYHTGANLADVSINKLLQGVNAKDQAKIKEASDSVPDLFKYVSSGDGFYKDGSFIQHTDIAYTGSYGSVLLTRSANILFLLEGTPWTVESLDKSNVYRWVFENFEPIIYDGYVMDNVRGRALSRSFISGNDEATSILESIIKLSNSANISDSIKMKSLVKQWLSKNKYDFAKKFKSINMANQLSSIKNDKSIMVADQVPEHYALVAMDRTVHKRQNYTFSITKSSKRISKYEYMNNENLMPWFQGDGMTYLYNDINQFTGDFWPTVDPYRLPGTTIDKAVKVVKSGTNSSDYVEHGAGSWSGGTVLETYGASGMEIANANDPLKGYKSWFMFDDEIVALGSGITSTDNNSIETIVENRKIKNDGTNKLTVDGTVKDNTLGWAEELKSVKWISLEGNTPGTDIGYYFMQGADLKALREKRTGKWTDINKSTALSQPIDPAIKENSFLTMYFDHGIAPSNASYSYVILPGKNNTYMQSYSRNPQIEILENNKNVHAVKQTKLNIISANFWKDELTTADIIKCDKKASVILKEDIKDNTLTIAVSDPTLENNGKINIEIAKNGKEIISKDNNIEVIDLGNTIKLSVDVNNTNGKTFTAKIKVENK